VHDVSLAHARQKAAGVRRPGSFHGRS
jgi:hypothetical protein